MRVAGKNLRVRSLESGREYAWTEEYRRIVEADVQTHRRAEARIAELEALLASVDTKPIDAGLVAEHPRHKTLLFHPGEAPKLRDRHLKRARGVFGTHPPRLDRAAAQVFKEPGP